MVGLKELTDQYETGVIYRDVVRDDWEAGHEHDTGIQWLRWCVTDPQGVMF